MIPLPTHFTGDGFEHTQIYRAGRIAIYHRKKPEHAGEHYEVVVIRRRKAFSVAGCLRPAREYYPRSTEWGEYGFTFPTREAAEAKTELLTSPKSKCVLQNFDTITSRESRHDIHLRNKPALGIPRARQAILIAREGHPRGRQSKRVLQSDFIVSACEPSKP